jgi:hypothetical protein
MIVVFLLYSPIVNSVCVVIYLKGLKGLVYFKIYYLLINKKGFNLVFVISFVDYEHTKNQYKAYSEKCV